MQLSYGDSSPRKTWNTSRSTAISDSSAGATPRWDLVRMSCAALQVLIKHCSAFCFFWLLCSNWNFTGLEYFSVEEWFSCRRNCVPPMLYSKVSKMFVKNGFYLKKWWMLVKSRQSLKLCFYKIVNYALMTSYFKNQMKDYQKFGVLFPQKLLAI